MTAGPVSSPHVLSVRRVEAIMREVIYAALPAAAWGILLFGWPALFLVLATVAAALACEALGLALRGARVSPGLRDGSAALTGLLLAMTLPPWAPWWIGVCGAGLAILLGKHVYGGLGQNPFNPAMLARVALLISFPVEMTTWANVQPWPFGPGFADSLTITFLGHTPDGVSGATTLGAVKTGFSQNLTLPGALSGYNGILSCLGWERGSLGETSGVLLALGGIRLLRLGIIRWQIPLSLLGTLFILALGFHWYDPARHLDPWVQLNAGAVLLIAFFIATDYVTSPNTPLGQILFGAGCGLLIFVIRTWGGYPDGAGFAVLLMNAATPLIDHYIRPRIYGRYRNGKPLEINPS